MTSSDRIAAALLATTDYLTYEELAAKSDVKKQSAIRSRVSRLRTKGWLEGRGIGGRQAKVRLTPQGREELSKTLQAKPVSKTTAPKLPDCFDSQDQFNKWRWAAMRTRENRGEYCRDCTPEYKKQMIDEGRCAYPKTQFGYSRDGELVGLRGGLTGRHYLVAPPADVLHVDGIAAPKQPTLRAGLLEAAAMAEALAEIAKAQRGARGENESVSQSSVDLDGDE